MKKRLPSFLAGMLTMALIGSIGVSALAASGAFSIIVDPVNIQVNGQTFQPKDANGDAVPVFAYEGTTYAPLRALAEAYGLNVGWDQEAQMATVGETQAPDTTTPPDYSTWSKEDEAAYQEFKGLWTVKYLKLDTSLGQSRDYYIAFPKSDGNQAMSKWEALPQSSQDLYAERLMRSLKGSIGVVLALCNSEDSSAIYAFSIFEDGTVWLGHN